MKRLLEKCKCETVVTDKQAIKTSQQDFRYSSDLQERKYLAASRTTENYNLKSSTKSKTDALKDFANENKKMVNEVIIYFLVSI